MGAAYRATMSKMLSRALQLSSLVVLTTFAAGAVAQDAPAPKSKPAATRQAPRPKARPAAQTAPKEEETAASEAAADEVEASADEGSGQDDVAGPEEAGDELFEDVDPEQQGAPARPAPKARPKAQPKAPSRPAPPPSAAAAPSPDAWQVSAGPDVIDYEEGDAIPPGYEKGERVRKGLVIAGAVTFGVSWLASAGWALRLAQDREEGRGPRWDDDDEPPPEAPLYVPLVGPWIALGTLDPDRGQTAVLVLDGVVQAGGLAMLVAGVAAKRTVLVRSAKGHVAVAPSAGGVSFDGSF